MAAGSAIPTASPAAAGTHGLRAWLRVLMVLTKFRLSALVLVSTLVAYLVADRGGEPAGALTWTLLGTALCAFAAGALNQVLERERDGRMLRTRGRPIPAGEMSTYAALAVGLALAAAGLAVLAIGANPLAAALALATLLVYLLAYTPLKPRSSLNTLVGAAVGALPPLIGWTGATGRLDDAAWLLALLLFLWQIPHFLALAWLYREDYARAGFRMLPAHDPEGRLTGALVVLYSLALLPLGLAMTMAGLAGPLFAVGLPLLGLVLLVPSLELRRRRDQRAARRLFLASVIYLPLALGLLLATAPPRPDAAPAGAVAAAVAEP